MSTETAETPNLITPSNNQQQLTEDPNQPKHIGILLIATAGQNGPLQGSDEEEIVLIEIAILDTEDFENVHLPTHRSVIKPRTSELNETILSEECKSEFHLTDDLVKESGSGLEVVIGEIDSFIKSETNSSSIVLLVEGQLPLRQCLHPEASAKEIVLPDYYNTFFDLKREYEVKYGKGLESVEEMHGDLNLPDDVNGPPDDPTTMTTKLNQMIGIVKCMLSGGHVFTTPEQIQMKLEPGICSRGEEIDTNCIVRARGLPWQSSDADIAKFFRGLNIAKGGVALCLSPQGRRNGEALIRFESASHREMALKRHKHHIGTRYIEVYKATGEDFLAVAGGNNNEAQAFLTKGAQVIVRMRGLPYDCTAKQVLDFFSTDPSPCTVLDSEEGVLFVRRPDGRATGDAFVLFKQEEDSSKALSKHRESIGSRYIELFRSTTAEVQQVLNRCLDQQLQQPPNSKLSNPLDNQQLQLSLASPGIVSPQQQQMSPQQLPQSILQQHMITAGTRKDCIRLRGLPYEAQVEHILEFLGEHAKNIVYQGVHMVYNSQGQPSGEAFIQMDSESSAYIAAQSKHHRYMIYFKKQRYIEVFQCSGEDMSCVLTGGLPLSPVGNSGNIHHQKFIQAGPLLQTIHQSPTPYQPHHPHYYQPQLIARATNGGYGFQQIFYWPYGSTPPVSPSGGYGGYGGLNVQVQQHMGTGTGTGGILTQSDHHHVLPTSNLSTLTINCPKSVQQHLNGNGSYDNIILNQVRNNIDFIETHRQTTADKHVQQHRSSASGLLHSNPTAKSYNMEVGLFMA